MSKHPHLYIQNEHPCGVKMLNIYKIEMDRTPKQVTKQEAACKKQEAAFKGKEKCMNYG